MITRTLNKILFDRQPVELFKELGDVVIFMTSGHETCSGILGALDFI